MCIRIYIHIFGGADITGFIFRRIHNCNIIKDEKPGKLKCFWDLVTEPHYRQTQDVYNFFLTSVNKFGTEEQVFVFDHMKNSTYIIIFDIMGENVTSVLF